MLFECYDRSRQETAHILHEYGFPIILAREVSGPPSDWQVHEYTAEEIDREFQKDDDLNLGLVLGRRSGLIEVVTREGDGGESHWEFHDLMEGVSRDTPTFESRYSYHRIFKWDERLGLIHRPELRFNSILVRVGAGEAGAFTWLPPSIVEEVQREWRLTMGDYDGGIMQLPDYVVDEFMAATPRIFNPEAA